MKTKSPVNVESLFAAIDAVILDDVPIMATDRGIPRKEQAALARSLFKSLGLKGISVTTPNYSMAHVVDVDLPRLPAAVDDLVLNGRDYQHETYSNMPDDVPAKMKNVARHKASKKIEAILAMAFPNHDDRSDLHQDYFDHKWSIS